MPKWLKRIWLGVRVGAAVAATVDPRVAKITELVEQTVQAVKEQDKDKDKQ